MRLWEGSGRVRRKREEIDALDGAVRDLERARLWRSTCFLNIVQE